MPRMEKKIDIKSSRLEQMGGKVMGIKDTTEAIHINADGPFILKLLDEFNGCWKNQKIRRQPLNLTHNLVIHPTPSSHILSLVAQGGYNALQEALIITAVPY